MNGQKRDRLTVLVTGASSGLGKATAEVFARAGWRVFGTSRRATAEQPDVEMLSLDVRSAESVAECVQMVLARAGGIDVLVNNAGVMHLGVAEETTIDEARAVFETNLFGVMRLVNAVLPHMRGRRSGRIVNIGSAAAWVGEPGESAYAASKHALTGYTEALRHEVWPLGIDVCLVEPGAFRTNVLEVATTSAARYPDYDPVRQAVSRTMQKSLRGGGDPRDLARLVLRIATRARPPRLRHLVGREARWLPILKVLMPQRLFDSLVRRGYGLQGPDMVSPSGD